MARIRLRTNAQIKAFFSRAKILAATGAPITLRLTLAGNTKRGGYISRFVRQARKLPRKIKRIPSSGSRLTDWMP